MLECLVKLMQKVSKLPKLEWIFRKIIIIIPNKRINQNIPRYPEKSCGLVIYVKGIILLSLIS